MLQADEEPDIDRFSWQQVVRAAEEIIVQCANEGAGGFVWIGDEHKWILELSVYEGPIGLRMRVGGAEIGRVLVS